MKDTDKAREYLKSKGWLFDQIRKEPVLSDMLKDIQDYADHQNAELIAENERLKQQQTANFSKLKDTVELLNKHAIKVIKRDKQIEELQSRYEQLVEGVRKLKKRQNSEHYYVIWNDIQSLLTQVEPPKTDKDAVD